MSVFFRLTVAPAVAESNTRFEYLRHRSQYAGTDAGGCGLTYDGSFIEALNKRGLAVIGLDLQSHGLSESAAGAGCPCFVARFDDWEDDVLQCVRDVAVPLATRLGMAGADAAAFADAGDADDDDDDANAGGGADAEAADAEPTARALEAGAAAGALPIFVLGQSLGGLLATRVAQRLGGAARGFGGAAILCPALSVEKIKAQPKNAVLLPLLGVLSTCVRCVCSFVSFLFFSSHAREPDPRARDDDDAVARGCPIPRLRCTHTPMARLARSRGARGLPRGSGAHDLPRPPRAAHSRPHS